MKRTIALQEISRHRAWLYGFAAAWIFFFHMMFVLPEHPALEPLRWLKAHGNSGVDMFVLLSAMGLYRSLQKDGSVLHFYQRRLLRVYLPMFLVTAIYYGFKFSGTGQYLKKLLVFPFWLGVDSFWFAPFILTMYLIYPLLYRLQQRSPLLLLIPLVLALVFPAAAKSFAYGWTEHCERALTRIPAFIIGCMLAPWLHSDRKIPLWTLLLPLVAYAALCRIPLWPISRYVCCFLAAFVILALTAIAPLFTCGRLRRFVYRCMAFLGGISLEVYLIQVRLASFLMNYPLYASGKESLYKMELFNTIASILLATLLQALCSLLIRRFEAVPIPDTHAL